MKKLAMKLLRLAAREGDADAKNALKALKGMNAEALPMRFKHVSGNWTIFEWAFLIVGFNGVADEIQVRDGASYWTLCE